MTSPYRRFASRLAWQWGDPETRWRQVDGTLLFVDISGFTALSEKLAARGRIGAEELTQVLGRVFGKMLDAAHSRGGTLLKFGGDALLLLFDSDDHPMQAAASAVEMRAALRQASEEPTSVGRISLRMSSGIHTGPINLFLVGESHKELIIAGPTASMTTVMETDADAGEIVVSRETARHLPKDFVGADKGSGLLLRKRRIHHPKPTFEAGESSDSLDEMLIPLGLRRTIGSGAYDSEHRVATVGFIGFAGLDALLARSSDEAASALDTLVRNVQTAVDREGVTFLASDVANDGGKIILTSGVPIGRGDDEGRILRAARQVLDSSQQLKVRIGLNRGHVFAGAIGDRRSTYTVMGDTVNLAARLMTAAPYGALYASPSVLDRSSTLFRTTPLEKFEVKGKTAAVEAYEVGAETGTRTAEAVSELEFTGRDEELARLSEALSTPGSTITITGESGIGKTRLIAEALDANPDIAIFNAFGEPARSESSYWAVRDSTRELLGVEPGPQEKMRTGLERSIKQIAPDLEPYLPLIGDVTQIDIEDTPATADLDTRFRPAKTAEVFMALLEQLIPDRLAIIAEDAHWMDDLSLALIGILSADASRRFWSVVITSRGVDGDSEPEGEVIALEPLTEKSIRSIAISATQAAPLRPHELDAIVSRAAGNPLFLGEILQVVRETGDASQLPESLDAVVSAEIDTLPPLARQVLRYAAVLGRSFATIIFDRLLESEEIELDDATWSYLSRFLDHQAGSRLHFKLSLVHSAAYHGLSYRRRKDLHSRAGETIEELAGDDTDAAADVLAYHFSNSGDHEKAWKYARVAARRAKETYANAQAAAHFETAIEASQHIAGVSGEDVVEVMIQLGDTLRVQGNSATARAWFARALRDRRPGSIKSAEIHVRRAGTWYDEGAWTNARRSLTAARKAIKDVRGAVAQATRANLEAFAASVAFAAGRFADALDMANRAVDLAKDAEEITSLARAYDVIDKANFMLGRDAPRLGADAISLLQVNGYLLESVKIMNNMGAFAYFDNDWNEAADWYRRGIDAAERSGHVGESGAANTRANLAELLISQRRYAEALPLLEEAKRVVTAAGAAHALPFIQLQEARAATGMGDPETAVAILEEVFAEMIASGDTYEAPETAIHLAEALVDSGRPEHAIEHLDRLKSEAPEDAARVATGIMRARALAIAAQGSVTEGVDLLLEALEAAREEEAIYDEALTMEALSRRQSQHSVNQEDDFPARRSELFARLGIVA